MDQSELVKQFLHHRDALMAFLLALTRDADVAEEVFQELGVAMLTEARKGTQPENFPAWARSLARHRVADHYRRQERRGRNERSFALMADALARAFDENEVGADEAHERLKHLRRCLELLGDRARAIVDLRYRGRRSVKEIAAAISWRENSVKVALSKARKALADCVSRKLSAGGHGQGAI